MRLGRHGAKGGIHLLDASGIKDGRNRSAPLAQKFDPPARKASGTASFRPERGMTTVRQTFARQ